MTLQSGESPRKEERGASLSPSRVAQLRGLQRAIMTLAEGQRETAQKVADIVTGGSLAYSLSAHWLEFDLCALGPDAISALQATLMPNT